MAYAGTDEVARLEKALDNTRRPVELIKIRAPWRTFQR
jgi:hypothetical protein